MQTCCTVLDHDLFHNFSIQFFGAWRKIKHSVLALFIQEHGNVAKLKITVYKDNPCFRRLQEQAPG